MPIKELVEARQKYLAKADILAKAREEAKQEDGNLDLSKVKVLGDDFSKKGLVEQVEAFRSLVQEVDGLATDFKKLDVGDLDSALELRKLKDVTHPITHPQAPETKGRGDATIKSISDWFTDENGESRFSKMCKQSKQLRQAGYVSADVWPTQCKEFGLKTLFDNTTGGWDPETFRLPGWYSSPTRPLAVMDVIPVGRTGSDTVKYMLETTFTNAAAEKAAGAAYAESTFVLTETTQAVEKITNSVPTLDEVLADEPQSETYLRGRLSFGIRQKLDSQVLVGSGASNQLLGAANVGSINTQAKGTDNVQDAIFKGMTLIRSVGFAEPGVVFLHPNDYQTIRLATANGMYLFGPPSQAGPMMLWGVPVVVTTAQTENTGLVIDNSPVMCTFFERAGVEVQTGFVNDDFTKGRVTLRAQMRGAMVWFRAKAICTVTGI